MTSGPHGLDDTALELALRDLGGALATPAPGAAGSTDPARLARARLEEGRVAAADRPGRWAWLTPAPRRRLGRGVALGLVAVVIVAAIAGAIGLGLPGIRIVPAPSGSATASPGASTGGPTATAPGSSPSPTARPTIASPIGSNLGLGDPVAIDGLAAAVDIPIRLPAASGVGPPTTAWLLDGRLTMIWSASPALPSTLEPGVGLVLGEFRGSLQPGYFEKLLDQGTTITTVTVDGVTGYWIGGAPHEIVYVDEHREPVFDSRRSVGDTLLWARGDVTYRLESGLGRAATLALAATLR